MRFEITLRDPAQADAVVPLLREFGIGAVNVTDVSKEVDPVGVACRLLVARPGLHVMTHAAAKHHDPHSYRSLLFRAEDCASGPLLVVSGHPRQRFDTIAALDMMAAAGGRMPAYCAYDPFKGAAGNQAEEDERLARKLSYPFVRGICMQVGMDARRVARAADAIRSHRADADILASVPVPTEGMLRRLREKPLGGIILDDAYLGAAGAAAAATKRHLAALRECRIEPLFFMDEFSRDRIETALSLTAD
ncbi:MAG: hypothetical protein RL272_181 [Candidatus Parcubacteria bacterium]